VISSTRHDAGLIFATGARVLTALRITAFSRTAPNITFTGPAGGIIPEVWRTTFEYSADGVDWTLLGTGTRISGGWQLAGVSLSPEAILRARGYAAGGENASALVLHHAGQGARRNFYRVVIRW